MRIVNSGGVSKKVLEMARKIRSSGAGRIVNLDLADFKAEPDFDGRNFFIDSGASALKNFCDYCTSREKIGCLIVFSRTFSADLLKEIFEQGISRESVMYAGLENLGAGEISFLAENRIKKLSLNNFLESIQETSEGVMEFAYGKELFLVFDFSVLDFFGLSGGQAIYILSRMGMMKNLKGVLISGADGREDVAARLLAELL